ncbi:Hypothetical protein A7982_11769 [Minicystis rosea]|nr:Hypothetical protein A7982_11769 [Minicystis rosea]
MPGEGRGAVENSLKPAARTVRLAMGAQNARGFRALHSLS